MTQQRHTSQFTGDDRAAVITPPGEGGIGVIQLAGAGSPAVVQAIFRGRRCADLASSEKLHYGHIVHEGEELDEVLVAVADTSPAGCAFEINCHGGIVAVERIMAALESLGVSRVQSHRWQVEASVPDEQFERYIQTSNELGRHISAAGLAEISSVPERAPSCS